MPAIFWKGWRRRGLRQREWLHFVEDQKAPPPIVTRKPVGGRVLGAADLAEILAKHRAGRTLSEAIRSTPPRPSRPPFELT